VPYNRGRKDLAMANRRSFSLELKRQVVQELLSGESTAAQLCRRHSIVPSLLYHQEWFSTALKIRCGGEMPLHHRSCEISQRDFKRGHHNWEAIYFKAL